MTNSPPLFGHSPGRIDLENGLLTCGERYAIPPLARQAFRAGYLGDPHRQPGSKGGWYDFLDTARPPTATMAGRGSGPRISRLRG